AVRDIFARLEFKTLLPRVFEAIGADAEEVAASAPPAVVAPPPAELDGPGLATWVAGHTGEIALTVTVAGGLPARIGVATADAAAE
ncbi:hypothetical protein ACC848_41460, partial [Rhizobium johnstonii]